MVKLDSHFMTFISSTDTQTQHQPNFKISFIFDIKCGQSKSTLSVRFNLFCVTCASNYLYSCCLLIIFFLFFFFLPFLQIQNETAIIFLLLAHQRIIITSCVVRWISYFSLKTRKYFLNGDELVREVLIACKWHVKPLNVDICCWVAAYSVPCFSFIWDGDSSRNDIWLWLREHWSMTIRLHRTIVLPVVFHKILFIITQTHPNRRSKRDTNQYPVQFSIRKR